MIEKIINDINYRLDEDNLTAEVMENEDYEGDIIIPETIMFNHITYRVTSIGERAFYRCYSLTSITIPNSVMSIGERAFQDCFSYGGGAWVSDRSEEDGVLWIMWGV